MHIIYIWVLKFLLENSIISRKKKYSVDFLLKKALQFQKEHKYEEAKRIYLEIIDLQEYIELFDYSIALNNLVVIYYEEKEFAQAKGYYEELRDVREKLFSLDYELYGIDYIYTKVMGVEWFKRSKDELKGAKKLLAFYKGIYNTTFLEQKISSLEYTQMR
jgi:tetratricopeptide (TPR) repeat protein